MWFGRLPGETTAEDLSVQSYDGQRGADVVEGRVLSLGFGQGEDLVMNSHYQVIAHVPAATG